MRIFRAARRPGLRACPILLALIGLAACGGGGGCGGGGNNCGVGGGNPPTLTRSTDTLTFNALPPLPPGAVDVMATLTGTGTGTLFIVVVPSNPAVASVTNVIITGPTTGQGTVIPGLPAALGPGTHTATIQVRACLNDP